MIYTVGSYTLQSPSIYFLSSIIYVPIYRVSSMEELLVFFVSERTKMAKTEMMMIIFCFVQERLQSFNLDEEMEEKKKIEEGWSSANITRLSLVGGNLISLIWFQLIVLNWRFEMMASRTTNKKFRLGRNRMPIDLWSMSIDCLFEGLTGTSWFR